MPNMMIFVLVFIVGAVMGLNEGDRDMRKVCNLARAALSCLDDQDIANARHLINQIAHMGEDN